LAVLCTVLELVVEAALQEVGCFVHVAGGNVGANQLTVDVHCDLAKRGLGPSRVSDMAQFQPSEKDGFVDVAQGTTEAFDGVVDARLVNASVGSNRDRDRPHSASEFDSVIGKHRAFRLGPACADGRAVAPWSMRAPAAVP
jgi:hypothetical protein